MPSLCSTLKQEYEALKILNNEFVSACEKAGNPRIFSNEQLRELQILKQTLERRKEMLLEKIGVSEKKAEEIMGREQYFGSMAVEWVFGIKMPSHDVPRIPFSEQELREAKERGEMLILRVDHLENDGPMTIQNMHRHFRGTFRVLLDEAKPWKTQSDFFTKDVPIRGWAIVKTENIPHSDAKNYLEQSRAIVDYLRTVVYAREPMPMAVRHAIQEFETYVPDESDRMSGGLKLHMSDASDVRVLTSLEINKRYRHTAVEAVYDLVMQYRRTGIIPAEFSKTLTSSRTSDGSFVAVSSMIKMGICLDPCQPTDENDVELGLWSTRRK